METRPIISTIGVDYSTTSPAITVHVGNIWSIDNCKIYYLTNIKKYQEKTLPFLYPTKSPDFSLFQDEYRFEWLSSWAMKIIEDVKYNKTPITNVFIEGYSFGSKGKFSSIFENTGLLKHKIFMKMQSFETVPPKTIKKFATGKGNSKKGELYQAFTNETGYSLAVSFVKSNPERSPISDIVDSYFIAKYGFITTTQNSSH